MRVNTFKSKTTEFIENNPGLRRKEYISAFMEMGMTGNSASLYHYQLVTKNRKKLKPIATVGPARDPKTGRYVKRAA